MRKGRKGHIQRGRVENTMEISPEGEEKGMKKRRGTGGKWKELHCQDYILGRKRERREREREEEREMYATFNKTEFQKGEGREGEK